MVRDFTERQFQEAAKRNGFDIEAVWLWTRREDGGLGSGYGMVMDGKGKILRRASLARALQLRERDEAKTK